MPVDYQIAATTLHAAFDKAESAIVSGDGAPTMPAIDAAMGLVFTSRTQAYRESLIGCVLARIADKSIDIRKPYVAMGDDAFNGRTLDESAVNPTLKQRDIPSSRGPFLSVFRRSVEFAPATREGLRDKEGYDAFLSILSYVAGVQSDEVLAQVLDLVAYKFLELREASTVPLMHIQRMSLRQIVSLVPLLLNTPSGGRFPMLVVIAAFQSLKQRFDLDWDILWQGINVADSASGAGGDIVVSSGGTPLIVAEITERLVDRNRVVTTFNNKIGPNPMEDYLFFVTEGDQPPDAIQQMGQYFAQGHEVNFVVIREWIEAVLVTVGREGRSQFITNLRNLLESEGVPAALRVAWNDSTTAVIQ